MNIFLRTARFDTLMEFPATENCDKSVYITTTTIPLKKHYYICNPFPHFPTKRRDIITTVLATAAIYYCHCCQCQTSAVLVLLLILTLCLLTAMGHWTFVFYVTTFLGFHILSHTYICWILIFTFFSQYLTINRLYIYIYWIIIGQASFETFWVRLPDLQCGRPSLLWVSGPRPASSATARWCLGSGSNEKQDRQDRQVPTGTSWPVAPEFCNENSSSSCHDDDGRTLATAGIQIELWSNTTAADWKSAAWVFSRTLPAKRDVGWIFHLGCKAVGKIRRTQELPTGGSATSATWECPQHGRGFERHAYPGDPGVEKGTNSNSFGNKRTHTHK